jgi:hypothetical protein
MEELMGIDGDRKTEKDAIDIELVHNSNFGEQLDVRLFADRQNLY